MIGTRQILVLAVAAVGLAVFSGCDKQKQLELKNARLSEQLDNCQAEGERLKAENQRLQEYYAAQQRELSSKDSTIDSLEADKTRLAETLQTIKTKYDEMLEGRNRPVVIGVALPPKLNEALEGFAEEYPNLVEYDAKHGMVKFKSDLTFPPGDATVNPQASATLQKLVEILKTPQAEDFAVYIAGHTDDMKIGQPETLRRHPTNWYLSAHRAIGVQMVLAKAGLDPERICVMGFGEYHPVAPNAPNNKGNEKNRRVEIWLVPQGQFLTPDARE